MWSCPVGSSYMYGFVAQKRSLGGNISAIFRVYTIIQRNYEKLEKL